MLFCVQVMSLPCQKAVSRKFCFLSKVMWGIFFVNISNRYYLSGAFFSVLMFAAGAATALEFRPGIGVGVQHTDNAANQANNEKEDLIVSSAVSASIKSNDGPFAFDAATSLSKDKYTQGTFNDQQYFYLNMNANWQIVKDRFSWFLNDKFTQRSIRAININTPNNIQDTNAFTLGANINIPVSNRQSISIVPTVRQYYFEKQLTNNNQYALSLNWNHQLHRLRSIQLSLSTRNIDYTERVVDDTRFTNLGVIFNATTQASTYRLNVGTTNVSREGGDSTNGFSGSFDWLTELSSRSNLNTHVSTDLTDTSSTSFNAIGGDDVQVTADVIRSSIFNVTYTRDDALLRTQVLAAYQKVKYSESPLDRVVKSLIASVSYPATRRLSMGSSLRYIQTEQLDIRRIDDRYSLGANLSYKFTREMDGYVDVNYRKKVSTVASQSFDEMTAYIGLSYGFGGAPRPTTGF